MYLDTHSGNSRHTNVVDVRELDFPLEHVPFVRLPIEPGRFT